MLRIARLPMIVCVAAGVVACAPVRVKQQPNVVFHVESREGHPIPGAVLHFERYSVRPSSRGAPLIETMESSDKEGNIQLQERSEWQAALFVRDGGSANYRWEWCVEKSGFAPQFGELAFDAQVPTKIPVVLEADGRSERCPDATSSGYRLGVDKKLGQ